MVEDMEKISFEEARGMTTIELLEVISEVERKEIDEYGNIEKYEKYHTKELEHVVDELKSRLGLADAGDQDEVQSMVKKNRKKVKKVKDTTDKLKEHQHDDGDVVGPL